MQLPLIPEIPQERSFLQEFRGYNRHDRIGEGEFYDALNLSNDEYPALVTRRKVRVSQRRMAAILSLDIIDGHQYTIGFDADEEEEESTEPRLYMYKDGERVSEGWLPFDPNDATADTLVERSTAVNGLWILVFPDKKYYDTTDDTWHSMEKDFAGDTVKMEPVDELYNSTIGNGHLPMYTKITAADVANTEYSLAHFLPSDTVHLHFYLKTPILSPGNYTTVSRTMDIAIASTGIDENENPYIIIPYVVTPAEYGDYVDGLDDSFNTGNKEFHIQISRPVPDLDMFIAYNNKIYGARYGEEDGAVISSIFVSSGNDVFDFCTGSETLGAEFTVGEAGPFTGAGVLGDSVYFFKRDCVVRVSGSSPADYYTKVLRVPGVAMEAGRSIAQHAGYLYYQNDYGIYRFDGEFAVKISDALGDKRYVRGIGAFLGDTYYITMVAAPEGQERAAEPRPSGSGPAAIIRWLKDYLIWLLSGDFTHTFLYDTKTGLWQRHNYGRNIIFAKGADGVLYIVSGTTVKVLSMQSLATDEYDDWQEEPDFDWHAEFGKQGYETPDQKHVGRILLRMRVKPETVAHVRLRYDNESEWETVATVQDAGIRTVVVPIIPRRCDVYQMRIDGRGEFRLYGISKTLEGGSDIPWHR